MQSCINVSPTHSDSCLERNATQLLDKAEHLASADEASPRLAHRLQSTGSTFKNTSVSDWISTFGASVREGLSVSNAESLVVVKLDHNGSRGPLVFEVLEQAGLLGEVSSNELEMVEPGAVGFRVARDQMAAVVLALECNGFADVRAYEVQPKQ